MKDAMNNGSIQECLRCKHKWISRVQYPKRCPNCKSPYWKKQLAVIRSKTAVYNGPLEVNPIASISSKMYPELKNRLILAMRDRLPIKFKLKDGEITEIL